MHKFAEILIVSDIKETKKSLSEKVKQMFNGTFGYKGDHLMSGFFLTDGKSCEFITKWTPDWWIASDWIEQAEWDIPVPTTEIELRSFAERVLG